jgi:hypothetical protein
LVASLGTGLGIRLDVAMTALMVATIIITALTAAHALDGEPAVKRVIVGLAGALLYLVAASFAEGAFKEPLLGMFLLAAVLHVEDLSAGPRVD